MSIQRFREGDQVTITATVRYDHPPGERYLTVLVGDELETILSEHATLHSHAIRSGDEVVVRNQPGPTYKAIAVSNDFVWIMCTETGANLVEDRRNLIPTSALVAEPAMEAAPA